MDTHRDVPSCTCPVLPLAAKDPRIPLVFEPDVNEYHFKTGDDTFWVLYYCPFCGGRVPESHRDTLFHQIAPDEQARLDALTSRLTTVDSVIAAFGYPEEDHIFRETPSPVLDAEPTTISHRGLIYRGLSATVDVSSSCRRRKSSSVQLRRQTD